MSLPEEGEVISVFQTEYSSGQLLRRNVPLIKGEEEGWRLTPLSPLSSDERKRVEKKPPLSLSP
jgi:hypothetical protein